MRLSKVIYLCLLVIFAISSQPAHARPVLLESSAASAGLCPPDELTEQQVDCRHLGPVHYRAELAALGMTLPLRPLPARAPDPAWAVVPYYYAQVVGENSPTFGSLEAAVQGDPVLYYMETGFDFVTYIDRSEVDGKNYYMIAPGVWMRGRDLSRLGTTSSFQGLEFRETPRNAFGWLRNEVEVKQAPGYLAANTGKVFYRYEIVQVYQVKNADNADWYLVGPDQWIEGRQVGRVIPNPTPPQGVTTGRWIEVNLTEQTLAVYDQERLVFATLVATGREGTWTRPGLFQIYKKVEAETMQGSVTADRSDFYYLEDVPWTMYFDAARALHGTFWHNRFGWPQSRGCVNLSPGDANWLFQWAEDGEWVYVWDPSGQTPTDPGAYGSGGA